MRQLKETDIDGFLDSLQNRISGHPPPDIYEISLASLLKSDKKEQIFRAICEGYNADRLQFSDQIDDLQYELFSNLGKRASMVGARGYVRKQLPKRVQEYFDGTDTQ